MQNRLKILIIIFVAFATIVLSAGENIKEFTSERLYEVYTIIEITERMVEQKRIEANLLASDPDEEILMPVVGVLVEQVVDTWHEPRGNRLHEGQDIFAPRGRPVKSATYGIVRRVGTSGLGGNYVFIRGAGGRSYYYAHLDKISPLLNPGDIVTDEIIIGFVGNTGNAEGTPPHLHFGIYARGGAIDPLPLMINREN